MDKNGQWWIREKVEASNIRVAVNRALQPHTRELGDELHVRAIEVEEEQEDGG